MNDFISSVVFMNDFISSVVLFYFKCGIQMKADKIQIKFLRTFYSYSRLKPNL